MATATLSAEKVVARRRSRHRQKIIDRLAGLFGALELDGQARLPLADCCTVSGVAVRSDILDLDAHDIAAAQHAVDREIEQCQVSHPSGDLQSRSDRPNVFALDPQLG
jgi:hypothetical protein